MDIKMNKWTNAGKRTGSLLMYTKRDDIDTIMQLSISPKEKHIEFFNFCHDRISSVTRQRMNRSHDPDDADYAFSLGCVNSILDNYPTPRGWKP